MALSASGRHALVAVGILGALLASGCQPELRPGTVKTIGGSNSGSVSASVSGTSGSTSVSGVTGSASASGAAPAASPGASLATSPGAKPAAAAPSKPDGIYTPVTDRTVYQAISTDYQEIVALTNRVNEGKPLPAEEILRIYEDAKHARRGDSVKSLRAFARDPARAQEFPQAAEFYKSPTFLDDPVIDAINGTGSAADYTPAQRRQAIQKGILRILNYWTRHYVQRASTDLRPGLVDEAWAIYMGAEVDGKYPNSLSALARSREANFEREGTIDQPLRQALSRAQQAAANKDAAAYQAAEKDIYSRLNALFYLASARYLNESLKSAQAGDLAKVPATQVEGLSFYRTIQPTVAGADPAADRAIVAFYQADPATLTPQMRDEALAALNKAAEALLLKPADLLAPADFT